MFLSFFRGPDAEKGPCQEKHKLLDHGKGPIGGDEFFTKARAEDHQRWEELGGLAACKKYEPMTKEIDWNFYSDSDGRGLASKVWTYVDMNPNSKGEFATGVLRFKAHYGKPVHMRMYNGLPKEGRDTKVLA